MFTDAQKARIEQIHKQILALNAELASIYAMARIRCVTEHEDEVDALRYAFEKYCLGLGDVIQTDGVIGKIKVGEEVIYDSRTTETSRGES